MLGLDLDDLSVDGSITKSPCGGEVSGRSPVDRGKQGTKRSVVTAAVGIPLHLDAGYDSGKTRDLLHILGYQHQIAVKGTPSPIQVGKRWVVERTHSWMNGYGRLRRSTDKRQTIVEFF